MSVEIHDGDVKRNVLEALEMLFANDKLLLQANVNERSLTHQLAVYLSQKFEGWSVDCEYNRNHDDPKRLDIQRTDLSDDLDAVTVYPDIIIHKRQTRENLLVIEAKKSSSNRSFCYDERKLKQFKSQLGYRFAGFVTFNVGSNSEKPCSIEWFE